MMISGICTRWRSQSANQDSSTSCAATASMACSASSTSGGSGDHTIPLRSRKRTSAAHAARLFPSGRGWFHASLLVSTAALSMTRGRTLARQSWPKVRAAPNQPDRSSPPSRAPRPRSPVTCSASQRYSATLRYRITWRVGRGAPCLAPAACERGSRSPCPPGRAQPQR